ncbi:hypothetical protein [Streptomyces sp. V4I2]|uniref:hypothetical protein n=1 Tax=Streptomyces sp. V4I2 TaxID=3042280 RepID=UPI002787C930|nr:hypothetical protein [Streptomyces sp. V4I2]MDQ1046258.1 hypothetical protein [Streptomyces sp. V4I2]
MSLHAIEIILTRTVRGVELKAARRISGMPMASSHDGKSIAVLVSARDEERAIKKVWRRLQDSLPIDVLCTVFPGPDGMLRMSIPFAPGAKKRIRSWAKASGKSTEEFLSQAIKEALARDRSTEAARQGCALNFMLHTCAWLDSPLSVPDHVPVSRLPTSLGDLVRRISNSGTRIVFTDVTGPIASLISERELRGLEDALAIVECEERKTDSSSFTPHDEAVQETPADIEAGEDGDPHGTG